MTTYNLVVPNNLIAKELRRFILLSQRHSLLRYTQTGNNFTVEVTWPELFRDRWRNYIQNRWGI